MTLQEENSAVKDKELCSQTYFSVDKNAIALKYFAL
jgi:hypothetical protein